MSSQSWHARLQTIVPVVGMPLLLACTGELTGAAVQEPEEDGGSTFSPGGPSESEGETAAPECPATTPLAVPKLLRLSNAEARNVMSDVLGVDLEEGLFSNWTPVAEVYGFDTMSETRVDARALDEQFRTAEEVARRALSSSAGLAGCPMDGSVATWESCGQALTNRMGGRAFRRPLRDDEQSGYGTLFHQTAEAAQAAGLASPFQEGMNAVLQAIFFSPHLFYKSELVPGGWDPEEEAFQTASKIALFTRASVADDSLWAAAESGELSDLGEIEQEARRMIDAYRERFLVHFGGQWLDFRRDDTGGDPLVSAMRDESREVFAAILEEGLSATRLLSPGFTVVDEPLAGHYGLAFDPSKPSPQRINTQERGGVLSQGYLLTRTAKGSDFRRAIHRGLWVLTRLLCQEMPRLDAATSEQIAGSLNSIDRTLPLSEQMEIHRTGDAVCGTCHGMIDPVGLALENYDELGIWRDTDAQGRPIESDLELLGQLVDSPEALSEVIGESEDYRSCVSTKLLTYALNRGPTNSEKCMAGGIASPEDGTDPSLEDLAVQALLASFSLTKGSE